MPEPFSTIIISGAAGAAATKLSEKAWEAGQKWLGAYFKDHQPRAIEKAEENSKAFLNQLAEKVARLEERQEFDRTVIDQAMEDPSFAALLQKALIGSAQTQTSEKHQILAQLVAAKLSSGAESYRSVVAPLACEAVINATLNQLKILAVQTTITLLHPAFEKLPPKTEEEFLQRCNQWLNRKLDAFPDVRVRIIDILHLESLSCGKYLNIGTIELNKILSQWAFPDMILNTEKLYSLSVGEKLKDLWEKQGLNKLVLTSTGQLLGFNMIEVAGGGHIDLSTWGEDITVEADDARKIDA